MLQNDTNHVRNGLLAEFCCFLWYWHALLYSMFSRIIPLFV